MVAPVPQVGSSHLLPWPFPKVVYAKVTGEANIRASGTASAVEILARARLGNAELSTVTLPMFAGAM
ncbi:MAG: hypothetical protein HKUEN07_07900 [Rhodocyclaceae bacterium]|nr:MAG: hypothetical protein HKUEN07_07900 [Rhodocyclaceae bacterium]